MLQFESLVLASSLQAYLCVSYSHIVQTSTDLFIAIEVASRVRVVIKSNQILLATIIFKIYLLNCMSSGWFLDRRSLCCSYVVGSLTEGRYAVPMWLVP